jgi:hypothetical protein
LLFDLFPITEDFGGGVGFGGAEDVRVTADHFVSDFADYGGNVEAAFFVSDLCVEENLEEEVAEFFGEFGVVGGVECVENLVGFFNEIGAEGGVGLFAVPWTTVGGAETGHDGDEFLEVGTDLGWREFAVFGRTAAVGFAFRFLFGFARGHRGVVYRRT